MSIRKVAIGLMALVSFKISYAAGLDAQKLLRAVNEEKSLLQYTYNVYYPSDDLANAVMGSFHHALLAKNNEQGYLVLTLTESEQQELQSLGFLLKPANDYIEKRSQQLEEILERGAVAAHAIPQQQYAIVGANTASTESLAVSPQAAVVVNGISGYSCYETVEETFAVADDLVATYPTLASMIDIGDSWEKVNGSGGYDLRVMKITNTAITGSKPKLFIHSAMHAREYATAALTLAFAKELLTQYDQHADISWIVDEYEIHILFHMNPDGRKIAEQGLLKRKNTNTTACGANALTFGVDLNRNFSATWNLGGFDFNYTRASGDACAETYRGPLAASEPETQAVESYIRQLFPDNRGALITDAAPLTTQGMHIDVHSFGELVLYPWGHTTTAAPNDTELTTLARKIAFFNSYTPEPANQLYLLDGSSEAVSYAELGVAQLTLELGATFFQDCSSYENTIKPDNIQALIYAAKVVSAPYLLPLGPDVASLKIKGRAHPDITQGTDVVVTATLDDQQYRHGANGIEPSQPIASMEYLIDQPFSSGALPIEPDASTVAIDGVFDSASEPVSILLNSSGLSLGRHTLYTRAVDGDGNVGAISAEYFTLIAGQYLEARALVACDFQNICDFIGDESLDTDGDISGYSWDFGDGGSSEESNPTRYYRQSGQLQASLTVTGSDGEQDTVIIPVEINVPGISPEPHFTVSCEGTRCTFDGSATTDTDNSISFYRWLLGDGRRIQGEVVEYDYAETGEYEISLIVIDASGWHAREDRVIQVVADVQTNNTTESSSGGGSISLIWVALLLLGLLNPIRRQRIRA